MQIARQIIASGVAIAVVVYLINQCRKPHGWLGRFFIWEMAGRHGRVTDWGLGQVVIEKHYVTLDIGCGGGHTISKLAAMVSEGKAYGIDYSAASVAAASKTNQPSIRDGHVEIHHGSVSKLPFPDRMFDLVTAVETHYYWPDLVTDLREIQRVLKPRGKLVIIAEAYKRRPIDPTHAAMKLLRAAYLTVNQHCEFLTAAGYSDVQIIEERREGWICALGRKPDVEKETTGVMAGTSADGI